MKDCKVCGKEMTIHYGYHCFNCTKPQAKQRKVYDLILVLMYLDLRSPGIRDRIWEEFLNDIRNDTYCDFPWYNLDEADLDLVLHEFPDAEDAIWFVSW